MDAARKLLTCQSKARYDDLTIAERAAAKIRARSAAGRTRAPAYNVRPYRCRVGDDEHWHLTRGEGQ